VILDKRDHDDRGLMQRRHPSDVLRVPSSAYTLTDADRARLASRFASGPTSDPY
jgi:hypothetical protein